MWGAYRAPPPMPYASGKSPMLLRVKNILNYLWLSKYLPIWSVGGGVVDRVGRRRLPVYQFINVVISLILRFMRQYLICIYFGCLLAIFFACSYGMFKTSYPFLEQYMWKVKQKVFLFLILPYFDAFLWPLTLIIPGGWGQICPSFLNRNKITFYRSITL